MKPNSTPPPPPNIEALILDAIFESAAAGIMSITSRGIMRTINAAACKMFGFTPDELIGKNVSVLMHGENNEKHDAYMTRYLGTGQSRIIGIGREVTGRRKDGRLFPLHLSIGEFAVEGETFFTGVLIDLSKQKAVEERLAHQEALFRAIYECLPDPVVITDTAHRIRMVNPAFTRVFGYRLKDLDGRQTVTLFAQREDWINICLRQDEPNDPASDPPVRILDFRRANGEVFPAAVVSTAIETEGKRALGHLDLIRDISQERRQEAQLMQAQRMEAIGQLTGGIAHDFNNILTVVIGNVELLEMRLGQDDGTLALAREAREAAEIGARLTDRLLTFGRRQMLETRRINLNEFVLGLMEILQRAIGENIDVSTSLSTDLDLTEVDPGEVENALLNLAINARDAMPRGGRLVIETRNVELDEAAIAETPELAPGRYVVLSVSDTGHGMSPEVKARAFEPFFSTKSGLGEGRGSGLGLATIYGFVKQSGGHATITSAPGEGTMVELYLSAIPAPETHTTNPAGTRTAVPGGDGRRVLVVEDNDNVRRLTCRRLTELGYLVAEAANAVAALEIIAEDPAFNLVFSDIVMPGGLSGLDLARELAFHFPQVRVLLTTGYAEEMLHVPDAGGPMPALLRKPYSQAELAHAIDDVLAEPHDVPVLQPGQ
ncbi:MAG TPA: PAS domain S-box protein [Hyphomicrobiaceae bacterium]|nr:PAS domain S-box protein [Hyphomicrobiaceae bacterium]